MKKTKAIFKILPRTRENPLLSRTAFFRYCLQRFRNISNREETFGELLDFYKKHGLFIPAYIFERKKYYSTFQVFNLLTLERFREKTLVPNRKLNNQNWKDSILKSKKTLKEWTDKFNKLLKILAEIQDIYTPLVRNDGRIGESSDYENPLIGSSSLCSKRSILLSAIQKSKDNKISKGTFNPLEILEKFKITAEDLEDWTREFAVLLKDIDPLAKWNHIVRYCAPEKRKHLKYEALIAQDLYEIANILMLFLSDLGRDLSKKGIHEVFDWLDLSKRNEKSKLPVWKERMYGLDTMHRPFEMLEFLTNEFNLNPKPRAIIFTEGKEWKGISNFFSFIGYSPELLGIEFRALGSDKLKFVKWVQFIEYMHEKQVYTFFIVDNENDAKQAQEKFGRKARINPHPYLKKVIDPSRIIIWGKKKSSSSFEEANFTNTEIAQAIKIQNPSSLITKEIVGEAKQDSLRTKGLVESLGNEFDLRINKEKFAIDLVNLLIDKRKNGDVKRKRELEKVVDEIGKLVMMNHQPKDKNHRIENFNTGLMG